MTRTVRRLRWGISLLVLGTAVGYAQLAEALPACPAGHACITVTQNTNVHGDGRCSLQEAALSVELGQAFDGCLYPSGADTILLAAGTFSLGGANGGPIYLDGAMVIGSGVGVTVLSATSNLNCDFCYFAINLGGPNTSGTAGLMQLTLQASNLTMQTAGVLVSGTNDGILDHVRISGFNRSGIENDDILTVTASTITNNSPGGGFSSNSGFATILNSTISNNQLTGTGSQVGGGGVSVSGGQVVLHYSTVANNSTSGRGGGIYVSATPDQGAAECDGHHVTVAFNAAALGGGGVYMAPTGFGANTSSTSTKWNASIIARNTGVAGAADDYHGAMRADPNISVNDGLNRNLVGVLSNPRPTGWNLKNVGDLVANPQFLGGLANNGGPTSTVALRTQTPRSPAIDVGNNDNYDAGNFPTDQRGFSGRVGNHRDLGSFESR